ncbi:hypothetical protein NCU16940 [Neurospora crassa OR74A]|uniref:Uncharacterized protein n=1 Tax=Neurospora crassa (strain ATCC 24698 / 74-OR23-1A / CBS 708.71 / DSM 1257 / FGSC 987) TaxID=367110 RepID=V5INP4_NEUCR|nr:hypothetical protein NCU16940 [Neurospora crassa OR74A]ESA42381.1 hypothetical protein NCU16940 [Neurospora crassa OR74A]|eukprot:XP_011394813.1 hypothetical protein NCU16940 [Neurospora crassa OR74A]
MGKLIMRLVARLMEVGGRTLVHAVSRVGERTHGSDLLNHKVDESRELIRGGEGRCCRRACGRKSREKVEGVVPGGVERIWSCEDSEWPGGKSGYVEDINPVVFFSEC